MTISLVSQAGNTAGGGATSVAVATGAVAVDDVIVVWAFGDGGAASTSCSDSLGNTWNLFTNWKGSANLPIYWSRVTAAGTPTITVSGMTAGYVGVIARVLRGVNPSAVPPLYNYAEFQNTSYVTSWSVAAAGAVASGDAVLAGLVNFYGSISAGGSPPNSDLLTAGPANFVYIATEDSLSWDGTTPTAAFSNSSSQANGGVWVAGVPAGAPPQAPTVVSTSSQTNKATATTTTVAIPAAGQVAGRLTLVHFTLKTTGGTVTPPAGEGWTQLKSVGTTNLRDVVYAKVWGLGGQTDNTTTGNFTVSNSPTTNGWGYTVLVVDNPSNSTNPWTSVASAYEDVQGTNHSASTTMSGSTVTVSGSHRTVLTFFGSSDDNNHGSPSTGTLLYGGTNYDQTASTTDYAQSCAQQLDVSSAGLITMTQGSNGADTYDDIRLVLLIPTSGTSLAMSPVSVPVSATAAGITPGTASRALTPVAVPVTAQAGGRTAGGVSRAATPATVTTTLVGLGRTAVASITTSPAAIAVAVVATARTVGGVSRAVSPAVITTTPTGPARAAAATLGASPAAVAVAALATARTAGSASIAVTPAAVPVTPIAPSVAPAAVSIAVSPAHLAAAAVMATLAAGGVSIATAPGAVPVTPAGLARTAAASIAVSPAGMPLSPTGPGITPGSRTLGVSSATVVVVGVGPGISGVGATSLPVIPVAITIAGPAPALAPGGRALGLIPAALPVGGQPLARVAGDRALAAAPAPIMLAPSGLAVVGATSLTASPATFPLVAVETILAPGGVDLAVAPAAIAALLQALDLVTGVLGNIGGCLHLDITSASIDTTTAVSMLATTITGASVAAALQNADVVIEVDQATIRITFEEC